MTIYTAIFGPYDDLKEPFVITPGWEYVCFTDQPLVSATWKIINVPCADKIHEAKRYKILPPVEGKSIYVDGTFVINCDLNKFFERYKSPITFMKHPLRSCVYKEAKACIKRGKDHRDNISRHIKEHTKRKLPANNGMVASGIILRDGPDGGFCELWWQEWCNGCKRDQIAWAYAGWKLPYSVTDYDYTTGTDFLHIPHLHMAKARKDRVNFYTKKAIQL